MIVVNTVSRVRDKDPQTGLPYTTCMWTFGFASSDKKQTFTSEIISEISYY